MEEGGDDVKSARPLRPGLHTCYNGRYSELVSGDSHLILKAVPSSDRGLQPDPVKLDSLVIAHQPWRGEYVPGPCTHRPSSHESRGRCGWNTSFLEMASVLWYVYLYIVWFCPSRYFSCLSDIIERGEAGRCSRSDTITESYSSVG